MSFVDENFMLYDIDIVFNQLVKACQDDEISLQDVYVIVTSEFCDQLQELLISEMEDPEKSWLLRNYGKYGFHSMPKISPAIHKLLGVLPELKYHCLLLFIYQVANFYHDQYTKGQAMTPDFLRSKYQWLGTISSHPEAIVDYKTPCHHHCRKFITLSGSIFERHYFLAKVLIPSMVSKNMSFRVISPLSVMLDMFADKMESMDMPSHSFIESFIIEHFGQNKIAANFQTEQAIRLIRDACPDHIQHSIYSSYGVFVILREWMDRYNLYDDVFGELLKRIENYSSSIDILVIDMDSECLHRSEILSAQLRLHISLGENKINSCMGNMLSYRQQLLVRDLSGHLPHWHINCPSTLETSFDNYDYCMLVNILTTMNAHMYSSFSTFPSCTFQTSDQDSTITLPELLNHYKYTLDTSDWEHMGLSFDIVKWNNLKFPRLLQVAADYKFKECGDFTMTLWTMNQNGKLSLLRHEVQDNTYQIILLPADSEIIKQDSNDPLHRLLMEYRLLIITNDHEILFPTDVTGEFIDWILDNQGIERIQKMFHDIDEPLDVIHSIYIDSSTFKYKGYLDIVKFQQIMVCVDDQMNVV